MALRKYLRPLNGLPDPNGLLSSRILSAVIAEANHLVTERLLILDIFHMPCFPVSCTTTVTKFSWATTTHENLSLRKFNPRNIAPTKICAPMYESCWSSHLHWRRAIRLAPFSLNHCNTRGGWTHVVTSHSMSCDSSEYC